ncbi:MAG: M14 family metallopeptidase [Peptostreptococcaceae bacterium]|nr:M14 family metallopeptidase [Peptostreptococcaceae bacterium]
MSIQIMNLFAASGEKKQDFISFVNTDVKSPITLIAGERDGKTVLIMGGIHSAEYVGIQSAIELASEISPAEISGNIILLPLVNTDGFEHRTNSMVYEDGKNLNRVFPGDKDGTLADKMAYTISQEIFPSIDYIIDLHCGDSYEELTPYVYAQGAADSDTCAKSLAMAKRMDVPYIALSKVASGGAYNYAGSIGIPGILMERGNLGVWSKKEVDDNKKDVRRILVSLGFLNEEIEEVKGGKVLENIIYQNADFAGCFYPSKRAGEKFCKGELLGEIRDYFGKTLQQYSAQFDGVILYQTASLTVLKDGPMLAYAEL